MDEILLFLTLKYKGQWISIYNSLQSREKILIEDIKDIYNKIDCKYITIIDDKYPQNLKQIYKPPFGLFCYGQFEQAFEPSNALSVIGELNQTNIKYLESIKNCGKYLIWFQPHKKQLKTILSFSDSNIFYCDDLNNSIVKNIKDELSNIPNWFSSNLIISEIYDKNLSIDYSEQFNKRIFIGLSKAIIIVSKIENNALNKIIDFCKAEKCKVFILKNIADNIAKYFNDYIDFYIVNDFNDIKKFFSLKS